MPTTALPDTTTRGPAHRTGSHPAQQGEPPDDENEEEEDQHSTSLWTTAHRAHTLKANPARGRHHRRPPIPSLDGSNDHHTVESRPSRLEKASLFTPAAFQQHEIQTREPWENPPSAIHRKSYSLVLFSPANPLPSRAQGPRGQPPDGCMPRGE